MVDFFFRLTHVCLKCPPVRPSTKSSPDLTKLNEIWNVGRRRWVMHDGMPYDAIQGQGHEPLKVGNPSIFNSCLLCHAQWELATDHWFLNYGTISKFDQAGFFLGRLLRVEVIKWVSNVRPCICTYVLPQKVSSISMTFGMSVEVNKWCMTVYSMTRSKVKSRSRALESRKFGHFQRLSFPHL